MSFIHQKQNGLIMPLFVSAIFIFILVFPVSGDVPSSLISALPQSSDISSNLQVSKEWESYPTSGNTVHTVRWGGYIPFSCPQDDYRVKNTKGDYVSGFASMNRQRKFQTPEEFQEWVMRYPDGREMSIFDGLPGSVIASKISDVADGTQTNNEYELFMWIDPSTTVDIEVWGAVYKGFNDQKDIFDRLGCTPSYAERQSDMEKFAESEVIRLGKLIYGRLKGEDSTKKTRDYGELIWTLRYYLPSQFGKYSDEVLYKALVVNETGVLGPDRGITYALKDNMMWDISAFKDNLTREIPSWQGSLVDEAGQNIVGKEIEDAMGIMDIAQSYLTVVDAGLGYESGITLPEFGPIYGLLGMYHELEKKMRFYRDNIVIPDIADDIYFKYKKNRAEQKSPTEAFDDAIYGSKKYYELRSHPVFKQWKSEDLDLVIAERFEQRYHTEELLDLQVYMLEHYDLFIKGIIWQYHEKLDRLERTCQAIVDGKIKVDVPYEPYKIEKWWYLPDELRGI